MNFTHYKKCVKMKNQSCFLHLKVIGVNQFTQKKESSILDSSANWDFNPILDSLNRES